MRRTRSSSGVPSMRTGSSLRRRSSSSSSVIRSQANAALLAENFNSRRKLLRLVARQRLTVTHGVLPRPVKIYRQPQRDDAEADERLRRRRDDRVDDQVARGEKEDHGQNRIADRLVRPLGVRHPPAEDEDRRGVERVENPRGEDDVVGQRVERTRQRQDAKADPES